MPEAKQQMDEIFVGKDRDKLAALRKKDAQKNLVERWKKVVKARPDLAERRLGYVPQIIESGWAVISIPDEGFAFTIGLNYRFGQPELLVAIPGLSPQDFAQVLNQLGAYVALGNRIGPGEPVELRDFGVELVFKPYSDEVFQRYATGYLATFDRYFDDRYHETGDTLPVLWTELVPKKRAAKKKATKKATTAKRAAKKAPTKKATKKTATKKAATKTKKTATKKRAAKKPARTSRSR